MKTLDRDYCFAADVSQRLQKQQEFELKLKRQLEVDEANLPDYPRPLFRMKKSKNPFTVASAYAFGRGVISMMMP